MSGGLGEYLVLRRVRDGHLSLTGSRYYNQGIRLGAHLISVLDRLLTDGRVGPVTNDDLTRLILTPHGQSHLTTLERLAPLAARSRHG